MGTRNPIPSCLRHLDGFVHSISDPGSPVNIRIGNITDTLQFKKWFKGSKVVDNTGKQCPIPGPGPTDRTVADAGTWSAGIYARPTKVCDH